MGGTATNMSVTDRLRAGFLLAVGLLVPQSLYAQTGFMPAGGSPMGAYPRPITGAGQAMPYGPPSYMPMSPPGPAGPMRGMPGGYGHPGAGYASPYGPPVSGAPCASPGACPPPYAAGPEACPPGVDGFVGAALPSGDVLGVTPLERFLETAAENAWFRLEYLLWDIQIPGDQALGARTLNTVDPTERFATSLGLARVEDLDEISFNDINGLRGTLGIPLRFGVFEFGAFALEQASDAVTAFDLPAPGQGRFVGTTTLADGQVSNFVRVFDEFYRARYTSDIFGGEANVVIETDHSLLGFKLMPMFGVRYLDVQEELKTIGRFSGNQPAQAFDSVVASDTNNNLYGANFGLRAELQHKWFSLTMQPELMVGANTYRARVRTKDFVGPGEGVREAEVTGTKFTSLFEVSGYARIHLSEHFSLIGGYNLTVAGDVIRPHESIFYNVETRLGAPVASAFDVIQEFTSLTVDGLIVGGEVRF